MRIDCRAEFLGQSEQFACSWLASPACASLRCSRGLAASKTLASLPGPSSAAPQTPALGAVRHACACICSPPVRTTRCERLKARVAQTTSSESGCKLRRQRCAIAPAPSGRRLKHVAGIPPTAQYNRHRPDAAPAPPAEAPGQDAFYKAKAATKQCTKSPETEGHGRLSPTSKRRPGGTLARSVGHDHDGRGSNRVRKRRGRDLLPLARGSLQSGHHGLRQR